MVFDIVWSPHDKIKEAAGHLKRHPEEVLIQNRWRFGWSLLDPAPLPDASGKVSGEGICLSLRLPGSACLNLGARNANGCLAALPYLRLTDIGNGLIGADIDGSYWLQDKVKKQMAQDVKDLELMATVRAKESEEREQRNEERNQKKFVLFGNYKKAIAALMGIQRPDKLQPDILETLYLMSRDKENIPEPMDYLRHFAEEILPEQEPEFTPSDDVMEFYGFCKRAVAATVTKEKKIC